MRLFPLTSPDICNHKIRETVPLTSPDICNHRIHAKPDNWLIWGEGWWEGGGGGGGGG